MKISEMPDSVFEAFFRQAVIENHNEELNLIPLKKELEKLYPIPPEFDKRMMKVFQRYRRKGFFVSFTKYTKKVAVIFFIVINIIFGLLLTSPDVRAAVSNFIVQWFEKFTSITYQPDKTKDEREKKKLRPEILPQGYTESSVIDLDVAILVIFTNDSDEEIHFSYTPSNDVYSAIFDNEYNTVENDIINDTTALIITSHEIDGQNGIVFLHNGYVIDISGNLPIDVLMVSAKSVMEIK